MASPPEKAKLIKASMDLRKRAVNRKTGLDFVLPPEVRARLEGVISKAGSDFETELLQRLNDLRKLLTGLQEDPFACIFLMPQLQDLALDIKGMGGTFGYHLLTDLGRSLQQFLADLDMPTQSEIEIVSIHVDALYLLLAQRIGGQGGELERELLMTLGHATDKVAHDLRDTAMAG